MQIHDLKRPKSYKKPKPRIGRGGKRGYTSGRGAKGQKSRAGHRIRPAIRDLIQRLPKKRGFKHKSIQEKVTTINLDQLEKLGLKTVNINELRKLGVLKRTQKRVKILSRGEVKGPITIEGLQVSKAAKEKLEKSGGTVIAKVAKEAKSSENKKEE